MTIPHNFSIIAGIMGKVVGTGAPAPSPPPSGGTPTIVSVTGPTQVSEGSAATITVVTANFPDGNTTLNWSVSRPEDFGNSTGTVVIGAGPVYTQKEAVAGATVDVSWAGDTTYDWVFGGTLSGSGQVQGLSGGLGVPTGTQFPGTSYFYGGGSIVTRNVTYGGDGTATFTVTPSADSLVEGDETFTVTVSGTASGTAVSRTSSAITIKNLTGTDIPTGTFLGRQAAQGSVINLRAESISDEGESPTARATFTTRLRRFSVGGTPGFQILIERDPGVDEYTNSLWFSPNGASNQLTETPVAVYLNTNAAPSGIRIEYRAQGQSTWTNLGWQSAVNDGDEEVASFTRRATAGAGGSQFVDGTIEVRYYGRSPGFNDTLLAEFHFYLQAYADATGF